MIREEHTEESMIDSQLSSINPPQRFFGISPGPDVEQYYRRSSAELSRLHPQIRQLWLRAPAHITIVPPFVSDDIETIHAWAESVAMESHPFNLEFAGFGNYGTETLYLKVKELQELNVLSHLLNERLMEVISKNKATATKSEEKGERFPFHPHVSLARHLDKKSFELARQFFERDLEHTFLPYLVTDFRLYRLVDGQYEVEQLYFLNNAHV